jgi:hypothetical protein
LVGRRWNRKDALLRVSHREHLLVQDAGRVVAADPGDVVAAAGEECRDPRFATLIEQEAHRPVGRLDPIGSRFGTNVLA